jgi:hypothetical protein
MNPANFIVNTEKHQSFFEKKRRREYRRVTEQLWQSVIDGHRVSLDRYYLRYIRFERAEDGGI